MALPSFENVLLDRTEADDDLRVVIVRGAGRAFLPGYDLTPAGGYGADAVHHKFRIVGEDGNRLNMGIRGGMAGVTGIWMSTCCSTIRSGTAPGSSPTARSARNGSRASGED